MLVCLKETLRGDSACLAVRTNKIITHLELMAQSLMKIIEKRLPVMGAFPSDLAT